MMARLTPQRTLVAPGRPVYLPLPWWAAGRNESWSRRRPLPAYRSRCRASSLRVNQHRRNHKQWSALTNQSTARRGQSPGRCARAEKRSGEGSHSCRRGLCGCFDGPLGHGLLGVLPRRRRAVRVPLRAAVARPGRPPAQPQQGLFGCHSRGRYRARAGCVRQAVRSIPLERPCCSRNRPPGTISGSGSRIRGRWR